MKDLNNSQPFTATLSNEFNYLLALVSGTKYEQEIDADRFVKLLENHAVLLVINKLYGERLNPELKTQLKPVLKDKVLDQFKKIQVFKEIIAQFNHHNIHVIPLKGIALAKELLNDPGVRESSDIDLLVKSDDVRQAVSVLESMGFRCEPDPTKLPNEILLQVAKDLYLWHDQYPFRIELHWKMFEVNKIMLQTTEQLVELSPKTSFMGVVYSSLSPENLLIYLCLHGTKHLWFRLKWILDIHLWLVKYHEQVDGYQLLELLKKNGVESAVLQGIFLSHRLFHSPLPSGIHTGLIFELKLSKTIDKRLKSLDTDSPIHPRIYFRTQDILFIKKGIKHRIKCLLPLVYSPIDWQVFALPRPLFFLYPVLRPFFYILRKSFKKYNL